MLWPMALRINDEIEIPDSMLEERFIRSPGAGGQNVNKVATAVQLRFDARASVAASVISNSVFQRLKTIAASRMNKNAVVVITASSFRTQERNRKDALDRLVKLIQKALIVPKSRRATRPSKTQKLKRLEQKKRESVIKKTRGRVNFDKD